MGTKVFNPDKMTTQQLEYAAEAKRIAKEIGIPPNLMIAAIFQESDFNPNAKSPTGPIGMGQLGAAAAKDSGVKDRLDPIQNMYGSARYLKARMDSNNGDVRAALVDYHDGPNAAKNKKATQAAYTHADTVLGHVNKINEYFPETPAQADPHADTGGVQVQDRPTFDMGDADAQAAAAGTPGSAAPEWGGMEQAITAAGAGAGALKAPGERKQQERNADEIRVNRELNKPTVEANKLLDKQYVEALQKRNDIIEATKKAQTQTGVDAYIPSQVRGGSSHAISNNPSIITNAQAQQAIPDVATGHVRAMQMEPSWGGNVDPRTGLALPSSSLFQPEPTAIEKLLPLPDAPVHAELRKAKVYPASPARKPIGAVGGAVATAAGLNALGGDNVDAALGTVAGLSGATAMHAHNPRTAALAAGVGGVATGAQYLYDKAREKGWIKGYSGKYGSLVTGVAETAKKARGAVEGPLSAAGNKISEYAHSVFDPRFDTRVNEQAKLANLRSQVEHTGNQNVPTVSLVDYEGHPFITSMSDRTAAGSNLLGINGSTFKRPVALKGGQDYMFNNPGQVWASAKGPSGMIMRSASAMRDFTGKDPLYLPWRMAPSGGDFAHMTGQAMLAQAEGALGRTDKRLLDKQLKSIIPNWQGIDHPDSMDLFAAAPANARKAAKALMDRDFREMGGLGLGEARLAVADPKQVAAPEGGLMNVGRVFTGKPMIAQSGHESYPFGVPGEGLGRLDRDIQVYQMLPQDALRRGMGDVMAPSAADLRALQMKPYGGIIDDKMLKSLGYADGGQVKYREMAETNPITKDLTEYLESQNAMPRFETSSEMGGDSARFRPTDAGPVITMNPGSPNKRNTINHELTHAADWAMGNQYGNMQMNRDSVLTPQELQYQQGYEKLSPSKTKLPLGPGMNDYRRSGPELRAFGVGNMSTAKGQQAGTPHVDATMATEQAILMDLAKRANKSRPAPLSGGLDMEWLKRNLR